MGGLLDLLLGGAGGVLLLLGLAVATVGMLGLVLKPDIFDQLHVAGLVTGSGVILVLLASIGTGKAEIVTSALLVGAFVLVTSSISTHAIAYAGVRRYAPGTGDESAGQPAGQPAGPSTEPGSLHGGAPASDGMRVLLAHDGSPAAEVAAELAAAMDWPPATVVRVLEAASPDVSTASVSTPGRATLEPRVSDAVSAAAGRIERPGVRVEAVAMYGDAADVVIETATSFGADLLVTGARRRGVVQSLLGMSAAGDIVDRAPCPVLVARTPSLRNVLLTTDGSPESAAAADVVGRWPVFDLARILVVTVATGSTATPEDHRTVDLTAAPLMDAGRDVGTAVLRGRPGSSIVDAARERAIDLIVIGSRGRTGLGRTLLGSVTGEILANAGCSVLVVGPRPRRPGGDQAA